MPAPTATIHTQVGHHNVTADAALRQHGIHDPCAFVGRIIQTHRRTGAYLTTQQWEDLQGYLNVQLCVLAVGYNPELNSSLSKHLHARLPLRINDWYRKEFVDTRYERPPNTQSIDGSPDGLGLHNRGTSGDYDDSDLRVTILRAA